MKMIGGVTPERDTQVHSIRVPNNIPKYHLRSDVFPRVSPKDSKAYHSEASILIMWVHSQREECEGT